MKVFEVRKDFKIIRAVGFDRDEAHKVADFWGDEAHITELATLEDYLQHESEYQCRHRNTEEVGDNERISIACVDCFKIL